MNKKYNINNLDELNTRLIGLKADYKLGEVQLKNDIQHYAQQFTIHNLIKKFTGPSTPLKSADKLNIGTKLFSVALPVLVNNTLLRGSGFITKTLVGLATRKVGKNLDAKHLGSLYNSVLGIFKSRKKKVVAQTNQNYIVSAPDQRIIGMKTDL